MFDEDELLDPQELEHLLYNQVYHSSLQTEPEEVESKPINDIDSMNSAGRYFHNEAPNIQPQTSFGGNIPNLNAYNYPLNPRNQLFNLQNRGFAMPHMLVSPINNILLLPNPPTQVFINNKEQKRRKRWRKKKKKRADLNIPIRTDVFESSEKKGVAEQTEKPVDIVSLSDSNDSDVCCIEPKPPLVLLSSDEDAKTKSQIPKSFETVDNDVVFVPTQPKEIETIVIEDEIFKPKEDTVTIPLHRTPEHIPTIQKEILGTPESTMSNDFLEIAAELTQNKFNFGLHGVDFSAKDLNKQPMKQVVERSETESSASDISTPVKTAVFNEVPFESATKNIFNEGNLNNFADFIVPKRSQNASTHINEEICSGSFGHKEAVSTSSDSSSESDYEDVGVRTKARLPSLSVFEEKLKQAVDVVDDAKGPIASTSDLRSSYHIVDNTSDVSDNEESKVNIVGLLRKEIQKELTNREIVLANSSLSEDDDDGEPYALCSLDSESSSINNMDSFITIDEDFDQTIVQDSDTNKENVKNELCSIELSDSDQSFFDKDDLENLGEDLQIINCEETVVKNHEPHDDTVQKNAYSFDSVWTEDKDKFYKESWGHENFNIVQVQKTMSDDPKLWKILDTDKEYSLILSPKKRQRCRKCRDHLHDTRRCPKLTQPKCVLCGIRGHSEPRCPNKVCTMCGRHSNYTTTYCSMCNRDRYHMCKLCKMEGHVETRCPDLWRRYFLTTKEGPPIRPDGPEIKEAAQLWCSGCAQFGHLEYACNYYNRSHPPTTPLVSKYEDIYGSRRAAKRDEKMIDNYDLRQKLQKKVKKVQSHDSPAKASPKHKQHANDIVHQNVPLETSSNEKQYIKSIFDRNKDLSNQISNKKKFSFLDSTMQYISKIKKSSDKKSRLLLNPFGINALAQQKPLAEIETSTAGILHQTDVPFNGFEPDEIIAPRKLISKDFVPKTVKDAQIFLRNAISRIEACRTLKVTEVWKQLKKEQASFSQQPTEIAHHTIRALFERLHIILFGIHQLLRGANALKNLKSWRKILQKERKSSPVPKFAVDDINKSYDYIFGKARRDLNYQQLINIVKEKIQNKNYLKKIDRDYNFFKKNCDGSEYKKLHTLYGRIKSGKCNETANIDKFRKTYKAFCNSLHRNKTNLRRGND